MTNRQSGSRGSKVLSGTGDNVGLSGFGFVVNADCTITSLSILNRKTGTTDTDGINTLGTESGGHVTLKQGSFVCVPEKCSITQIKLASGSIVFYKDRS